MTKRKINNIILKIIKIFRIINNVISEILDPRRHGAAAGQFHFQASPM